MIAFLRGTIKFKGENYLIVENAGVGYRVFVSMELWQKVEIDEEIELYTHQHVREDALQLFGFLTIAELRLFEQLISVSGIGPKTGLAVFAEAKAEDIISAIMNGDATILKRVSGIGAKTAERIVLELKNKVSSVAEIDRIKSKQELGADADAVEALVALGYSVNQARAALRNVSRKISDIGEKVREALKMI